MTKAKSTHYILLDLVRFLAISAVVGVHIAQALKSPLGRPFGIEHFYYVSIGGVGVTVFIILSGLVLELNYGNQSIRYWWFIKKRIFRLYPMYYMAFAVGIVGVILRHYAGVIEEPINFGIIDLILSLSAGYAFVGEWGGPILRSGWFIAVIVSLYLMYPLLSRMIHYRKVSSLLCLFVISCFSRFFLGQFDLLQGRPLDWFPFCRVFEFGLGVFIAYSVPSKYFVFFNDKFGKFNPVIIFLSIISYPLYLVHIPIFDVMKYFPQLGVSPSLWVPLFIIISLCCSVMLVRIDQFIAYRFHSGRLTNRADVN